MAPKPNKGLLYSTIAAAAVGLLVVSLGARQILDARPQAKEPIALEPAPDRLEKVEPRPQANDPPAKQANAPQPQAQGVPELAPDARRFGEALVRHAKIALDANRAEAPEPPNLEGDTQVLEKKSAPKPKRQKIIGNKL